MQNAGARGTADADPRRVFLGWDRPLLAAAADHLVERFGDDLHDVVLALPGRRAGRRLEELLAARGVRRPAEVTTAGFLTDRLLTLDAARADRTERTLAWAHVLRQASDLSALISLRPADDDFAGWLALAAELRGLHAELALEGLEFQDVARELQHSRLVTEVLRWEQLARLQRDYRAELTLHERADPHDARWEALHAAALDQTVEVVLVGVTDLPRLLHETLVACAERVTALVFAPTEREAGFDALGGLVTSEWIGWQPPLDPTHWWIENDAADQAERVCSLLRTHATELSAHEISVGLPDEQVAPAVMAHLAGAGLAARHAAGVDLAQTPLHRLLTSVAEHLRSGRIDSLGALLRHPDLEQLLHDGERSLPAELLDAYCATHLPGLVPRAWRPLPDDRFDGACARGLTAVTGALESLLGELTSSGRRALPAWMPVLRAMLRALYDARSLGAGEAAAPDDPDAVLDAAERRLLRQSLELVGHTLVAIEAIPPGLASSWDVTAADALELVAAELASGMLPPAADDDAIELLGWLELPLDDAALLIVTGFNDGVVPESINGHAFLPDSLRRRLGLTSNEDRMVRDTTALTAIIHSRPMVHLISGRRSLLHDPLLPSRLALQCSDDELPDRVRQACREVPVVLGAAAAPDPVGAHVAVSAPPCPEIEQPLESMSVTDFGAYLRSPYSYYLERRLRLRRAEDGQREMDPMVFGILTHTVLERFGSSDARHATRAETIEAQVHALLDEVAGERFGKTPQPAVAVQLVQLRRRLSAFADSQAVWAAQGWRILENEWCPEGGSVPFNVDDVPIALRGRIDRIDRHEQTGELMILDYKTGEQAGKPRKTHGPNKRGRWKDLQLPLYLLLAESLDIGPGTGLGYFTLPRDGKTAGVQLADWTPDEHAEARRMAAEIVRRIRRGEVTELGTYSDQDPIWMAIAGVGLIDGPVPRSFELSLPDLGDDEGPGP